MRNDPHTTRALIHTQSQLRGATANPETCRESSGRGALVGKPPRARHPARRARAEFSARERKPLALTSSPRTGTSGLKNERSQHTSKRKRTKKLPGLHNTSYRLSLSLLPFKFPSVKYLAEKSRQIGKWLGATELHEHMRHSSTAGLSILMCSPLPGGGKIPLKRISGYDL